MSESSIPVYTRTIESGKWFAYSILAQRVLNLVTFLVLARLLAPQDYGVITIIFAVADFLDSLSNPAIGSALLQQKESIEQYLDTSWTFEFVRSFCVALLVYVSGPAIGAFFSVIPAHVPIIQWSGLFIVLGALGHSRQILYFKELEYHKIFWRDTVSVFVYSIVTVLYAFSVEASAWALFWGYCARYVTSTLVVYWFDPVMPRMDFKFGKLRQFLGYGKWVYGQNMLDFLLGSLDKILVGRLLDTGELGFYSRARDLPQTLSSPVAALLRKVGFSAYVKVQDDLSKLQRGFLQSLDVVLLGTVPFALLLLFEGGSIITVLLGTKWLGVVVPLKIFSVGTIFLGLTSLVSPLFAAVGRPDVPFFMNILQIVLLAPSFYLGVTWHGLPGGALASVVVSAIILLYAIFIVRPLLKFDKSKLYPSLVSVIGATAGTFCIALPTHLLFHVYFNSFFIFVWSLVLGLIYVFFLIRIGRRFAFGPYHTIRSVLSALGWKRALQLI